MTARQADKALQRMVASVLLRAWVAWGLLLVGCLWSWWLWLGQGESLTAAAVVLVMVKCVVPYAPTREEVSAVLSYYEGTG